VVAQRLQVFWSGPALADLRSIRGYVARERPQTAKRLGRRIEERVLALREHPDLGRTVPELPETGYRELIEPPYRIVYDVARDRIEVLRVWDSRRSPESFQDEVGSET
jgi:plasmid stabilization system protein ParE